MVRAGAGEKAGDQVGNQEQIRGWGPRKMAREWVDTAKQRLGAEPRAGGARILVLRMLTLPPVCSLRAPLWEVSGKAFRPREWLFGAGRAAWVLLFHLRTKLGGWRYFLNFYKRWY